MLKIHTVPSVNQCKEFIPFCILLKVHLTLMCSNITKGVSDHVIKFTQRANFRNQLKRPDQRGCRLKIR